MQGLVASTRTEKASLFYLKNGVVIVEVNDNEIIDTDDLKEIIKAQGELTGGIKCPVVTIPGEHTSITYEARHYASTKEAAQFTSADAFVIRSLPQKILADFYIRFQKPVVPTKICRTKEEALKWIEKSVSFSNEKNHHRVKKK